MTNPLRLVLALLAAIVGGLFALTPSNAPNAAGATSVLQVHAYDTQHHSIGDARITAQRGPPGSYDRIATHDAVDRWSRGALARHRRTSSGSTTTYAASAGSWQIATPTATTGGGGVVDSGEFSFAPWLRVAANAGSRSLTDLVAAADATIPSGFTRSTWGELVWGAGGKGGGAATNARALIGRSADELAQIPGLNRRSATAWRDFYRQAVVEGVLPPDFRSISGERSRYFESPCGVSRFKNLGHFRPVVGLGI